MVPGEQGRGVIRMRSRRRGQYTLRILGMEVGQAVDRRKMFAFFYEYSSNHS